MRIRTKLGDDVEVPETSLIRLPDGLLGFEDFQRFALVPQGEETPFLLLQSLDEPQLAFLTIDPRLFAPDYLPELSDEDLIGLGLTDLSSAVILSIVVIPEDPRKMTANLQGPLIINPATREGRQLISRSSRHSVRHPMLGEG